MRSSSRLSWSRSRVAKGRPRKARQRCSMRARVAWNAASRRASSPSRAEGSARPQWAFSAAPRYSAGFPRGGVANGDDDVRRCAFEGFAALAVQAVGGDAGLFEGRQAARMHPPAGLAAGAACLETRRGQVVEHGFGKNAAATVGRAHEQDSHGCSCRRRRRPSDGQAQGQGRKGRQQDRQGQQGADPEVVAQVMRMPLRASTCSQSSVARLPIGVIFGPRSQPMTLA